MCWIAECEICDTPMVVWRWHGIDPSPDDLAHMHGELARVTAAVFDGHYVDDNMRNIPDHYHAHARPTGGFFGHGHRRDRLRLGRTSRRSGAAPRGCRSGHG